MAAENPPTEKKLAWLRENGIVPYSKVATFCALIFLLTICFTASYNHSETIKELMKNGEYYKLLNEVWPILLPAVITLLGTFLTIMLQTKFLFKPSLIIPKAARISPFNGKFSISNIFRRLFYSIIELFIFIAVSTLSACIALKVSIKIFSLPLQDALPFFQNFGVGILPALIFLCLICAVIGVILSRILFRRHHRMSREELELEERGLYD